MDPSPALTQSVPSVIATKQEVRDHVRAARRAGHCVGVVPTMGALHEGHLSLVQAAQKQCDFVVVTIFVNPTQFGPGEDFQQYPRPLQSDLEQLAALDVDLVFAPSEQEMYPPGHSTMVRPPEVARPLEGQFRPHHFQGVTTIVLKLFNATLPDIAFFGQKDYQQSLVIRRMVADLDVPVHIQVCPTVRESDGLAMSSRNAYLSDGERQTALAIHRSLNMARERVRQGQDDATAVQSAIRAELLRSGIDSIDYAVVVDSQTLAPLDKVNKSSIALIAAHVGTTRLIDNSFLCQ